MKKKSTMGMSVGACSILAIFVLLSLTTFATLSLLSSNADYKLTKKVAQANSDYVAADAQAQQKLAEIDGLLIETKNANSQADEYFSTVKSRLPEVEGVTVREENSRYYVNFQQPVGEAQQLQVTLELLMPDKSERYAVTGYQLVYTREWQSAQQLPVFGDEGSMNMGNGLPNV